MNGARVKRFFGPASATTLQWMIWVFVCLMIFVDYISEDGPMRSGIYAVIHTIFYVTITYLNILVLFPRLFDRGKKTQYVVAVVVFLLVFGLIRAVTYWNVFQLLFGKRPDETFWKLYSACVFSNMLIYLLSLVLHFAINYFSLKKQAQEILLQKSHAELNLLKSQVQPHFLFNTLNNIYYESYRESPRTALLIERLSEIMRYFVDESPRQYVQLSTEIRFLENYMALEQIRIRYGVNIRFVKECDLDIRVPPMLLMTFVENVFKHGIDKTSPVNSVEISLKNEGRYLHFETRNKVNCGSSGLPSKGFGIKNLRERLGILYGDDFELTARVDGQYFTAFLSFPLT